MDVVDVLRRASDVVERAGVAADLRPVAFSTAVDLILKDPAAAAAAGPAPAPAPLGRHQGRHAVPAPAHDDEAPAGSAEDDGDDELDLDPWDDAAPGPGALGPRGTVRRLGAVPSSSTAAHRSATGPRVAARVGEPGAPGPGRAGRTDRLVAVGPQRGPLSAVDDPWGHIADALGVRPELLDRVWEERGGRLQLAGDPARFGRTRAQRVGTAAVLLLAALRWSGQDGGEPVPDAVVRAEVERLGLLDTGNYTKHLAGRRHLLSTTGSGRTATYKLRYDGLEEARTIAQHLLEDA